MLKARAQPTGSPGAAAGERSAAPRRAGEVTKQRILQAALQTLTEEGFAGTSARAIARAGRFNQALIFYHFGGVQQLLLAALDESSGQRLARYRAALADAGSITELTRVMRQLYEEDLQAGLVAAVQELVAAASAHVELRQAMVQRMGPWVDLSREMVERVVRGTRFEPLVPAEAVAFAITALYLGMETVAHLDGDRAPARSLFDLADRFAPVADLLLQDGAG